MPEIADELIYRLCDYATFEPVRVVEIYTRKKAPRYVVEFRDSSESLCRIRELPVPALVSAWHLDPVAFHFFQRGHLVHYAYQAPSQSSSPGPCHRNIRRLHGGPLCDRSQQWRRPPGRKTRPGAGPWSATDWIADRRNGDLPVVAGPRNVHGPLIGHFVGRVEPRQPSRHGTAV